MRRLRVRAKTRVLTEEEMLAEAEFQQHLEKQKKFAEYVMQYYDSLPREVRDIIKDTG